jgi:CRISPR type III-A-associated protein Csm2
MGNRGPQQQQGRGGVLDPGRYARDAEQIIVEDNVERLVQLAEELARTGATRTSVRRLYGEARRIDLLLDQDQQAALRRARLLEPRLNYQVKRDEKLGALGAALVAMIQKVGEAANAQEGRTRYRRLTDFFEAVVAYLPEK